MMKKITLKKEKWYGCFYTALNDDCGLICKEFIKFLGLGKPSFITVYASPKRIHRKGCHKIERKTDDDYVWIDGERNTNITWHFALRELIQDSGLGNVFYVRVIGSEERGLDFPYKNDLE